jgi:uridine kinase
MNIVEAYIKFNKELIILLSGLSGSGKSSVASMVSDDFKIKKIDIESYCIKDNDKTVMLTDENGNKLEVTDWDHIDAYDWNKINEEVNKHKENGVIVCGPYFPTTVLKFKPSFHIDIKLSKQILIEKRHKYIKEHLKECPFFEKIYDTPFERIMINKITYSHYVEYRQLSKINHMIDVNDISKTPEDIYDNVFDFLIEKIQEYINESNKR